jgi:hypothetical protein
MFLPLSDTTYQITFVLLAITAPQEPLPQLQTHALWEHTMITQALKTQIPASPHLLGSTNLSLMR